MSLFCRPILALMGLAVVACTPRLGAPAMPYDQALADRTPRSLTVVAVHDGVETRPEGAYFRGDVTHWVEVNVLNADDSTTLQTWPYDADDRGARPPIPGTQLVVAPAEWLVPPGTLRRVRPRALDQIPPPLVPVR